MTTETPTPAEARAYLADVKRAMKRAECSIRITASDVESYRKRGLDPHECACLIAYGGDFYEDD